MSSIYSNSHTVNTAMFMKNLINGMMGKYSVNTNFTLNTKYSVQQGTQISSIPTIGYVGIGRGGSERKTLINSDDGETYYHDSPPKIPSAENLDIFDPIPLRIISVSEYDALSDKSTYENYRMRAKKTFANVDYYCWYLKKIDFSATNTVINTITDDGTVAEYTQESTKLNNPIDISDSSDLNTKLVAYAKANVSIKGSELKEYVDVIGASADSLYFNELGVYTGIDIDAGNNYQESIGVQLAIHRTFTNIIVESENRMIDLDVILTNGASIVTLAQT